MNSKSYENIPRAQKTANVHSGGTNWIVIASGALLGTLSLRFGCKLKRVLSDKQTNSSPDTLRGLRFQRLFSIFCFSTLLASDVFQQQVMHRETLKDQESARCNRIPIAQHMRKMNTLIASETSFAPCGTLNRDADHPGCQVAVVPSAPAEVTEPRVKDVTAIWVSAIEHIELPRRPFHRPSGPDSPCASESVSDIFSKREVIHKLRQQLKRRDDMILEMQSRISEQRKIMNDHTRHNIHLQSQLDAANRDMLQSEKEIQRFRRVISDHRDSRSHYVPTVNWKYSCDNFVDGELELPMTDGEDRDIEEQIVEMLKREVAELKEFIEGKDYLLHSYKEQKMELALKVNELQLSLDSLLPNIL